MNICITLIDKRKQTTCAYYTLTCRKKEIAAIKAKEKEDVKVANQILADEKRKERLIAREAIKVAKQSLADEKQKERLIAREANKQLTAEKRTSAKANKLKVCG